MGEHVWHLPGVAKRFNITEATLRRCMFEQTGGMFPELITRSDIETFLPPIGGQTIYIFGNPDYCRDESKACTVRVHDECNGSDVFGTDICTCRPYLIHGIEECVKTAQQGGVGVIEITLVLQHQFENLVIEETEFQVSLSFEGKRSN